MQANKVNNYHYYEQLGFKNFKSWSQDDLSQFLVWDFLHAYGNTLVGKDFTASFIAEAASVAKPSAVQAACNFLEEAFLSASSHIQGNDTKPRILFQTSRYGSIISAAKRKYRVGLIDQGLRDRLFIRKHFSGYMDLVGLHGYVRDYFKKKDISYLHRLLSAVEQQLKAIHPDYLVLGNDLLPVERAMVLVSKKLGITTLEIQHGAYADPAQSSEGNKAAAEPLINGKAADYVLVWGNYFKNLYVKEGMRDPRDIYVLGYPYAVEKVIQTQQHRPYSVCYLGQSYERYNKDFLPVKIETIRKIWSICQGLGLPFTYRPHPWNAYHEQVLEGLPGIHCTPPREKIGQTLRNSDIFVSVFSTSLLQAAIQGKVAVQTMDFPVQLDNFENLGASVISVSNADELKECLVKLSQMPDLSALKKTWNNDYIETRYDPGRRFLEIIQSIENNHE